MTNRRPNVVAAGRKPSGRVQIQTSRNRAARATPLRRSRCGYALIEIVAVMAAVAVILSLAVMTIHTMYRATDRLHETSRNIHSAQRLRTRFTTDAHRATQANVIDKGIEFQLPNESTVRYTRETDRIVRLRTTPDSPQQRDTFSLAASTSTTWEIDDDAGPIAILRIVANDDEKQPRNHRFDSEIIAVVNLQEADE